MQYDVLAEAKRAIRNLVDVQTADGNWNYDPYMHGVANGLLLSQAVLDQTEVVYLDAPENWLSDKPEIPQYLPNVDEPIFDPDGWEPVQAENRIGRPGGFTLPELSVR